MDLPSFSPELPQIKENFVFLSVETTAQTLVHEVTAADKKMKKAIEQTEK